MRCGVYCVGIRQRLRCRMVDWRIEDILNVAQDLFFCLLNWDWGSPIEVLVWGIILFIFSYLWLLHTWSKVDISHLKECEMLLRELSIKLLFIFVNLYILIFSFYPSGVTLHYNIYLFYILYIYPITPHLYPTLQ